jgi:hypothetical protein
VFARRAALIDGSLAAAGAPERSKNDPKPDATRPIGAGVICAAVLDG